MNLTLAQVNQAKTIASQTQQPLLAVLEEASNMVADDFLAALGALMHYPTISILQLYSVNPIFVTSFYGS